MIPKGASRVLKWPIATNAKIPRLCFVYSCNQRVRVEWDHAWMLVRLKELKHLLAQHAIDAKKTLRISAERF